MKINRTELRSLLASEGVLTSAPRLASSPKALAQILIEAADLSPKEGAEVAKAMVTEFLYMANQVFENKLEGEIETSADYEGSWSGTGRMTYRGDLESPPEYAEEEGDFSYPGEISFIGDPISVGMEDFFEDMRISPNSKHQIVKNLKSVEKTLNRNSRFLVKMLSDALKNKWKREEDTFRDVAMEYAEENIEDLPLQSGYDLSLNSARCHFFPQVEVNGGEITVDAEVSCVIPDADAHGQLDYSGY